MSKPIYTVVTFENMKLHHRNDGSTFKYRDSQVVGFYHDQDKAIKTVETNACDIYEDGYYPYALVEEVYEGLYAINTSRSEFDANIWYKWDKEKNGYHRIESCPEDLKSIVNFSIG